MATASQNMSELSQLPAFVLLMELHHQPSGLTGDTQRFGADALTAINELLKCLSLLTDTIATARKLNCSPVLSSDRREKLEKLLFGNTILLAQEAIPLEQRSLLTPAITNRHVSADQLLAISDDAFTNARTLLLDFQRIVTPFQDSLRQLRPVIEDLVRRNRVKKQRRCLLN